MTLREALTKIINMIDAPHFNTARKYKIRDIAEAALAAQEAPASQPAITEGGAFDRLRRGVAADFDMSDPATRTMALAFYWQDMALAQRGELERTWHVLKDFGAHPGRTDDRLADSVRAALKAAQSAPPAEQHPELRAITDILACRPLGNPTERSGEVPAMAAAPSSRWIQVFERLPDVAVEVLVYCQGAQHVGIAYRAHGGWRIPEPQAIGYDTLTHWMPLPKSPETQVPPTQAEPNSLEDRAMPLEPVAKIVCNPRVQGGSRFPVLMPAGLDLPADTLLYAGPPAAATPMPLEPVAQLISEEYGARIRRRWRFAAEADKLPVGTKVYTAPQVAQIVSTCEGEPAAAVTECPWCLRTLHIVRPWSKPMGPVTRPSAQPTSADAVDAARYRWLREHTVATGLERFVGKHNTQFLDAAIDAELEAPHGEQ